MLEEQDRQTTPQDTPQREDKAGPAVNGEAAVAKSRLQDAIRRARLNEAERSDVILELREAEAARLEMLHASLRDLFDEIPPGTDLLECSLVARSPPRLWIDVIAYVVMGRDKRTYRFVKETRYGPKIILESTNLDEVNQAVTDYVAHRLLERARALDSDTTEPRVAPAAERPAAEPVPVQSMPVQRRRGPGWFSLFVALLFGALLGAGGLFAYGYYLVSFG
ncbi:hypothetical protein [Lutibaculum baratangense]|uniref:Uncharacterized protein n=1 Tax=Lutibaculum baratangense AMV1 TaxID=631454 RepID=V4T9E2_9HYPH|nr:hypothetical protein [Lutibaculum baratangense]ESR23148.1 hypothetical protein N177_3216 [Lutibaculum baratangense AMV1]